MPMVDYAIEARVVQEGILEDLVEVETHYCQASYGLLGPPGRSSKEQRKLHVPDTEAVRRIRKLLHEGKSPSFTIELSAYPYVEASVAAFVKQSIREGQLISLVGPAPMG